MSKEKKVEIMVTDACQKDMVNLFGGGWYAVRRIFKNIWWEIINFPANFAHSFDWFCFMWTDRDWDSLYFVRMMRKKLLRIEKAILNGHHSSKYSSARIIRLAVTYLDLGFTTLNDDIHLDKLFTERYGKLDTSFTPAGDGTFYMNFRYMKCDTPEKQEYADQVSMRIHRYKEYKAQVYRKKFFDLLNKYILWWWA